MIIQLNGSQKHIETPTSIADLLGEYKLERATVIIEYNKVLLDETASITEPLKEGDTVEIVRFVGGG